ncbi:MAG: leucyl/phenylalanyl-tRNA--protein transferase [Pseudomonadota bacterium]
MSDKSLTPQMLLAGYASGIFPMANSRDDPEIFWVRPEMRGIIPLNGFHVSKSLERTIRKSHADVRLNSCFADVVSHCANRPETWINQRIYDLYIELHKMGYAHSVEVFDQDGALWGGIYGVALGSAFFGESMFSRKTDGSKIALTYLVARLKAGGFSLFDTQFVTEHLCRLGAVEIPRADYDILLSKAVAETADINALGQHFSSYSVIQASTQTS